MLTIENYHKLINKYIVDDWTVRHMYEQSFNDTYIIKLEKLIDGIRKDKCTISLERKSHLLNYVGRPAEPTYFFNYNSQRTNVCAGADWLADIDNMVGQIGHILKENNKADWLSI